MGGKRVVEFIPKYLMLSSHTARRTSITNMRLAGVPDVIVMKIHGIKSHKTLERYTKIGAEEAGEFASGHDYFKR